MNHLAEFCGTNDLLDAVQEVATNSDIDLAIVHDFTSEADGERILQLRPQPGQVQELIDARTNLWYEINPNQEDVDKFLAEWWAETGLPNTKLGPFRADTITHKGKSIGVHIDDIESIPEDEDRLGGVGYSLNLRAKAEFGAERLTDKPYPRAVFEAFKNRLSPKEVYVKGPRSLRTFVTVNPGDLAIFSTCPEPAIHAVRASQNRIGALGEHAISRLTQPSHILD